MKKIVIALDYSPYAEKVATMGLSLANALKAEICLVHVIHDFSCYAAEYSPLTGFSGYSPDVAFKQLEEQENEAIGFLNAIAEKYHYPQVITKALEGSIPETILHFSEEYEADLIIIGGQDHHGMERWVMEDTVGELIKHSDIPVLIIPSDKQVDSNLSMKSYMQYL